MKRKKIEHINLVLFNNVFPDESGDQIYLVLEIMEDPVNARALIQPLFTNMPHPPVLTVLLTDLVFISSFDIRRLSN